MIYFCYLLALFWGVLWAFFLQFTDLGQFLASRRTWITVVVGVGVDLLIVLLLYYTLPTLDDPLVTWLHLFAVVGFSSLGIIGRSLWRELSEAQQEIDSIMETRNGR